MWTKTNCIVFMIVIFHLFHKWLQQVHMDLHYKGKTWYFVQIQNIQGNDLENKFGKGIIFFEMTMVENLCFKFSLTIAQNKEYNNIWFKCTFFNKTKFLKGNFESSSTRLEVSFSKLKYLEFVDWTVGIYFMNYSPTIANKPKVYLLIYNTMKNNLTYLKFMYLWLHCICPCL